MLLTAILHYYFVVARTILIATINYLYFYLKKLYSIVNHMWFYLQQPFV